MDERDADALLREVDAENLERSGGTDRYGFGPATRPTGGRERGGMRQPFDARLQFHEGAELRHPRHTAAPHLAEELWQRLGHADALAYEPWPTYNPALVRDETVTIAVQVNGKLRATVEVAADADQAATLAAARAHAKIQAYLQGKTLRREVVIPGRLVNLVVS